MNARLMLASIVAMTACHPDTETASDSTAVLSYAPDPDPFPHLELEPGPSLCDASAGCILSGSPNVVLPAPDGIVLDAGDGELMIVDTIRNTARTFSRKGKGPGEFSWIAVADFSDDGNLRVYDHALKRMVTFDANYTHVSTTPVTLPPMPELITQSILRGDHFYGVTRRLAPVSDTATESVITLSDATAKYRHLLSVPAVIRSDEIGMLVDDGLFMSFPVYQADRSGNIYFVNTSTYAIQRFDPQGKRRPTIVLAIPPTPVTKADIDRALERNLEAAEKAKAFPAPAGVTMPNPRTEARERAFELAEKAAEFFPALSDFKVMDDGTMYLRRYTTEPGAPVRWDAFTAAGTPHGTFHLPPSASIRAGNQDRILVVERDSLDLAVIRWHKVTPVGG